MGAVVALFAACANAALSEAETRRLEEARRLLQAGDPDGALAITDELLAKDPHLRPARLCAAEGYLQLARIDRRGLNRELVLQDAVSSFMDALDLDDQDPAAWLGLARARYELRDFEGARADAGTAIEQLTAARRPAAEQAPAQLLAARCELELLIPIRQEELAKAPDQDLVRPEPATLELANAALARLDSVQRTLPADGYQLAAKIYQWLGQYDAAIAELERGIRTVPEVTELHLAYQKLLVSRQQQRALSGAYSRFVRENPGVPILLYYQGQAEVCVGDQQRQKSGFQPAIDAYRKAAGAFAQYAAMVPAHSGAAGEWLAICELSIARVLCEMGDLEASKQHLFAAAAASPRATEYDLEVPALRDSFGSHYAGVVFAISRALSQSSRDPLPRTLAFNEEIIARHPDRWGFVYNNAALPARDLGVQLTRDLEGRSEAERKAAMTQAMELWERSYRYYERAVVLSPKDARIINDCGLMLVYHLNRDYDRARALFEQAIAVGQPQLDALPADTPREDRNNLEEAVGDAWQNIAVLLARHQQRPFAEYEPFCRKAIEYYPYRQREAAKMLESEGRPPASDATAQNGAVGGTQGGAAEQLAKVREQADQQAQGGDLDSALQTLDKASNELKGYAPFHALRGEFNLRYARAARDDGRKGVEFLYDDAARELAKAVELDSEPVAPRLLLAQTRYEQGELELAAGIAADALLHMQSLGGGKPEESATAHRIRAEALARSYMARKGDGKDDEDALRDARTSFRHLEEVQQLDASVCKTWSTMESWAGSPSEAVGVYARALQRTPDDQTLLAAVVDTAVGANQAATAVAALAGREDAAGLWYLGRARYFAAAELRSNSDNPGALAELDQAIGCFEASMQKNKAFADSCAQWLAISLGKKGNIAFWMDRLDDSERWLLASVQLRPDRIADDLGLNETTKLGLLRLADKILKQRDLRRVEAIYRAASTAANGDIDLLNNAGLFARDYGNELERDGAQAKAQELYEQSYKAYSRAHELDPANVRLANDKGLIAIWYLERDWDASKQLLEQAIALGDRQLAGFAGEPQERQDLDEAIGDCWENLALWQLKHGQDPAAAKAAAERSMQHYPGQSRPGARRHLQAAEQQLRGK